MFPCNCHPPFPRPEPFSPLPRPGTVPDWGKWIRDRLAEKGALLAFPTRAAFPSAGSAPNLYLAEDTGVVYRWGGEGYAVLVDPSPDVETYPGRSAFPDTGRAGVIYIDASANLLYRWNGTGYVLLTTDLSGVESRLADVESKVPAQATAQNQLADKAFVNSSIATNTAFYISDNGRPFRSLADLENYEGALTNNDYAFVVGRDAAGNTTYTRYKWNEATEAWGEEYVLNNSSFTAEQWAAISSGITSGLVAKLGALPTAEALAAALAGKQDKLTFETSVTRGSDNPVKSGGIWLMLWGALSALPTGFSSLYDWCVSQLAKYLPLSGGTMTGGLTVPNLTVGSRKSGTTVGVNSVAEGYTTAASGHYSHAEGSATTASGHYSHAEGSATTASGYYSHAEGSVTTASGSRSHAEGHATITSGSRSHAEGHATITQNDSEHAQGRFNASHKASDTLGDAGNTLSSIGFGDDTDDRKNAVETMQDGKTFIYGLGGYDGTNPTSATDLASAVNAKASKSDLDPLLFAQYYPEGNVKNAAEFTAGIKYDAPDTTNRTITVKPFCNMGDAANDNSNLSGRVVIPPFVDAIGNPYISDDGTRYKVVGVSDAGYANGNTNLTAVITPTTLTGIGVAAFWDCSALTTMSLPAATGIGERAFADCRALTAILIPAATNIGELAISYCSALTTVSLPAVTRIELGAFYSCTALTSVDFGDTPRSSVPSLGASAFNSVPTSCKIIVPDDQYDEWVAAPGWSDLVTAGYKFLRHSEWEYARKYEVDKKADKPATFTAGNLAALDAIGNPTDSGIAPGDKLDSTSAAPAFSSDSSMQYAVGSHVTYNGKLYVCTTATTGGTWDASKWAADTMTDPDAVLDITAQNQLRVVAKDGTVLWAQGYDLASTSSATLACDATNLFVFAATSVSAFSDAATYAVDDRVTYGGKTYKCTTAVESAGAWTGSANWSEDPDVQAFSLPTATTGKVGDFGLDVDNTANAATSMSASLTGLASTFSIVVPKGENLADMLTFEPGEMAELYFTLTAFRVNNLPTWHVLKQAVENGGATV